MTKQTKLLLALTRAAKKAKDPDKIKAKIKAIKDRQVRNNWLGQ